MADGGQAAAATYDASDVRSPTAALEIVCGGDDVAIASPAEGVIGQPLAQPKVHLHEQAKVTSQ